MLALLLALQPTPAETLNTRLLAARSATTVLQQWCAENHLADPASIRAIPDRKADRPADAHIRAELNVGSAEPIRYRRVRLVCGNQLMSQAENWYVPGRLTPEMNRALDSGDTPFGTA